MTKHYSTKDVATELDVSEQTIRLWSKTFHIPHIKSSGNIRFAEDIVQVFETIKDLRDSKSGFETIRRRIWPQIQVVADKPVESRTEIKTAPPVASAPMLPEPTAAEIEKNLEIVISESIKKNISANNELAEKYARATYRIGELESTVRFMQEKIDRLTTEQQQNKAETEKLLPAGQRVIELESTITQLKTQLQDMTFEQEKAKQALAQPPEPTGFSGWLRKMLK